MTQEQSEIFIMSTNFTLINIFDKTEHAAKSGVKAYLTNVCVIRRLHRVS